MTDTQVAFSLVVIGLPVFAWSVSRGIRETLLNRREGGTFWRLADTPAMKEFKRQSRMRVLVVIAIAAPACALCLGISLMSNGKTYLAIAIIVLALVVGITAAIEAWRHHRRFSGK